MFRTLAHLEPKASSTTAFRHDDEAQSQPWHIKSSLLKHFQGYLEIFRDIGTYSATLTGSQLGVRGTPALALFRKSKKNLNLGSRKDRDGVHLWVKFSFRNAVSIVSTRKDTKIFPCRAFFPCAFDEMFIEVP